MKATQNSKATKSDLIDAIANDSPLTRSQIDALIHLFFKHIRLLLVQRGKVELRGFGTFLAKIRKARANARNPKTGERFHIAERRVVLFRPGREMREQVLPIDTDN